MTRVARPLMAAVAAPHRLGPATIKLLCRVYRLPVLHQRPPPRRKPQPSRRAARAAAAAEADVAAAAAAAASAAAAEAGARRPVASLVSSQRRGHDLPPRSRALAAPGAVSGRLQRWQRRGQIRRSSFECNAFARSACPVAPPGLDVTKPTTSRSRPRRSTRCVAPALRGARAATSGSGTTSATRPTDAAAGAEASPRRVAAHWRAAIGAEMDPRGREMQVEGGGPSSGIHSGGARVGLH